jgi:hypothetical protein
MIARSLGRTGSGTENPLAGPTTVSRSASRFATGNRRHDGLSVYRD